MADMNHSQASMGVLLLDASSRCCLFWKVSIARVGLDCIAGDGWQKTRAGTASLIDVSNVACNMHMLGLLAERATERGSQRRNEEKEKKKKEKNLRERKGSERKGER